MIWLVLLIWIAMAMIWLMLLWLERRSIRHLAKDFTGKVLCKLCVYVDNNKYCYHPDNIHINDDLDIITEKYTHVLNGSYDCKNHKAVWWAWIYKKYKNIIQHQYKL